MRQRRGWELGCYIYDYGDSWLGAGAGGQDEWGDYDFDLE